MNLDFEFIYFQYPAIALEIAREDEGIYAPAAAILDTGSELSLFDLSVANDISFDLRDAASLRIRGIGGEIREAKLAMVHLRLMGRPELSASIEVAFVPEMEILSGNILGLDVLNFFDLALSHSKQIGYLGVTDP